MAVRSIVFLALFIRLPSRVIEIDFSFAGFDWVLPGFTGFYRVLLGFTGFYWVLMGFT